VEFYAVSWEMQLFPLPDVFLCSFAHENASPNLYVFLYNRVNARSSYAENHYFLVFMLKSSTFGEFHQNAAFLRPNRKLSAQA